MKGNNGAKVDVNTTTGSVDYSIGNQIIGASDGKYVGTLEYDGTLFTGSITNVVVGLPLQFYFLGNVTPAATNVPTCLVGFNNKVTVIFAENTFTSSKEAINLPAGNGEKWAILMPQAALTGGEAYSANESHIGTFGRRNGVSRRCQCQPRRWCDLHLSCAVNKHDSICSIRKAALIF